MTDELKLVPCGCGGEAEVLKFNNETWLVMCNKCRTSSENYTSKDKAITAWNRAMGERTAKAIEHDASVTVDGYKYQRSEYLCENCKKKVLGGDDYY